MFGKRSGFDSRIVLLCAAVATMWCGLGIPGLSAAELDGLSFEERLSGHRAIEQVYWKNRIWPKGNPSPKPAFETMLPEDELRARVVDLQRLSSALEVFWHRPITDEDLQGEIDRMVRDTAWPTMLEELFEMLGRDPVLVSECLARPLLVERRAREMYAADARIHGNLESSVRRELEQIGDLDDMPRSSGRYTELEWVRYGDKRSKREVMAEKDAGSKLILDPGAWQRLVTALETDLGGARLGELSPLNETTEQYSVTALLERSDDRLRVATVVWPKRDFEVWWVENRSRFAPETGRATQGIRLPNIKSKNNRSHGWVDTSIMIGSPGDRAYHTANWTGNEMVVWGGTDGMGVFFAGSRFFPATNSWLAMTNDNHADSRAYHSAVWTGTDVVVWGGWFGGYRNNGGFYRPSTNTWYSVSTPGAPSARREHSANWTGTYMVIFGGWDGTDILGVGGRWSGSNHWYSMSTTNAPSARIGHAAVYCEDTYGPIVIWGGETSGGLVGNGREYDANANAWETIPSTSLSPRTDHSGVYMGSYYPSSSYKGQRRVVIWGGNIGGTTTTTSGAGYDPVNNQWSNVQATTTESRQGHTAIASDWRMMVWGGFSGSTLYNSGGIYNPVNNDWEPSTTIGAPTPRSGHTAVWRPEPGTSDLDGQMIAWGGEDATDYCDTGGSYTLWWDMLVAVEPEEFDAVPGGAEYGVITAQLYSLSGYAGTVTLSCDPSYQVDCTFEQNPVTLTPNGVTLVDIDVHPDSNLAMTNYTLLIGATHDEPRGYQVTMKMQDFDVTCEQSTVSVPPGGSVDIECTVSSERNFDDPVSLSCDDPYTTCAFAPSSVTPPQNGTATTTLTIEPVFGVGVYPQTVEARSHSVDRRFDIQVTVSDDLIFSDGFDTGSTSAWSSTVG